MLHHSVLKQLFLRIKCSDIDIPVYTIHLDCTLCILLFVNAFFCLHINLLIRAGVGHVCNALNKGIDGTRNHCSGIMRHSYKAMLLKDNSLLGIYTSDHRDQGESAFALREVGIFFKIHVNGSWNIITCKIDIWKRSMLLSWKMQVHSGKVKYNALRDNIKVWMWQLCRFLSIWQLKATSHESLGKHPLFSIISNELTASWIAYARQTLAQRMCTETYTKSKWCVLCIHCP